MPIIDIRYVATAAAPSAQQLADTLGAALAAPPGTVWVRLQPLARGQYAENGVTPDDDELPVFVTVLVAHLPGAEELARLALAITAATAQAFGRPAERVHAEFAPEGAGRLAFGGRLIG